MVDIKLCYCCKKTKSVSNFAKSKQTKTGYSCYCRDCINTKGRENYSSEKTIDRKRRSRYGVDTKWYKGQLEKQNNKCAICERVQTLCIDHDHQTGEVRELLCRSCNGILGRVSEKISLLEATISYLKKHKK